MIVGASVLHMGFAMSEKFLSGKFFSENLRTAAVPLVATDFPKNFTRKNFSLRAKSLWKTKAPTITGKLLPIFSTLFQLNFATCDSSQIESHRYYHSTCRHSAYGGDIVMKHLPSKISFLELVFDTRTDFLRHLRRK